MIHLAGAAVGAVFNILMFDGSRERFTVTPQLIQTCKMVQCGALTQADVGKDLLWKCSNAGWGIGPLPCSHPDCQQFGGCRQAFHASSTDVQPDVRSAEDIPAAAAFLLQREPTRLPSSLAPTIAPTAPSSVQLIPDPLPMLRIDDGGLFACASDVKLCPDGSFVSRQPPDCAFSPCSSAPPVMPTTALLPGVTAPEEPQIIDEGGLFVTTSTSTTEEESSSQTSGGGTDSGQVVGMPGTMPPEIQALFDRVSAALADILPDFAKDWPWWLWVAIAAGGYVVGRRVIRTRRRRRKK